MSTLALTPLEIADRIIELVRASAPGDDGVETSDRNDRLLVAAYGRAFRCFVSIRDLAARGEADDAAVLNRTLFSITLQSLYLVDTNDPRERYGRFRRAGLTYFERVKKIAREEVATGAAESEEIEKAQSVIDRLEAEGVRPLPSDYDIAKSLDLLPFYTRVYRTGSDVTHYSIGAALDGFLELTHGELIGPVVLEKPESEKADDVLIRAALTYGVFLEKSEPVVGHGLTREVRKLLVDYFNAQTTASSAT